MYPNSRSPWAAWFRFMKSMSIVAHGSDCLAWVCRCSRGLRSASRPWIHIFAGENVCIQAMTPTQASVAVASRHARRIASALVSTGFQTSVSGHVSGRVQRVDDPLRLLGNLAQRLLAVHLLAAGEEPELQAVGPECLLVGHPCSPAALAVHVLIAVV